MDERQTLQVTPAVDVQVIFQPDGKRLFQVRFAPLDAGAATDDLSELLDRILFAVDRQMARYELVEKETALFLQLERIKKYEALDITLHEQAKTEWEAVGRHGSWSADKLSPQQRNARDGVQTALQRDRAEAQVLQAEIRYLKEKVLCR